jgi:hypothetical protein
MLMQHSQQVEDAFVNLHPVKLDLWVCLEHHSAFVPQALLGLE